MGIARMQDDGWKLRKLGGEWVAALFQGGKRVTRRKAGTADRAAAERLVADLNRIRDRKALPEHVSTADIFDLYLKDRRVDGKNTKRMEQAWKPMAATFGNLRPDQITKDTCRKYVAQRRNHGVTDGGIRTEMSYLRSSLRFAEDAGHIKSAPRIYRPPPGRPRERYLAEDELSRLVESALAFHVKLFILLAIATAGRPSHILQLTWDRVDLGRREINLDDPERDRTQKGRARVPINDTAFEALSVAREVAQTSFVIESNDRGGFKSIKTGVAAAARRAGISGVSPYVLRHTAGVMMATAGVPLEQIAQFMGHTNVATTYKHYARFAPEHLRKAASSLNVKKQIAAE